MKDKNEILYREEMQSIIMEKAACVETANEDRGLLWN